MKPINPASKVRPGLTMEEWSDLLSLFARADAGLLARRELRRRTDTKFVLSPDAAADFARRLSATHAVLSAGDELIATYRTLYFDTPALEFFHQHRRGRRIRHKARIRHYPDRRLSVLEVKTRRTAMLTSKAWRAHDYGSDELSADDETFVATQTGVFDRLLPQVSTHFHRLMLLGMETDERVTIDLDLCVDREGRSRPVRDVAIVEVKQWPGRRDSPAMATLRAAGHRPSWASKYCTSIALTHPELHPNTLLPGLRMLTGGVV